MDQQHTVMVIEDEALLLEAVQKKLTLRHFNVLPFDDGRKALEYLKTSDKLPDAIWLDYYLKDMNGLEFVQAMKEHPKLSGIPVIVVSNSASENNVNSMLTLGVKKYILKAEHTLDDIIANLNEYLTPVQE